MEKHEIITVVGDYYSQKIKQFGAQPLGVDWNSEQSQYIRFAQLVKTITKTPFSVLDYGCGYGELYNYLLKIYPLDEIDYAGYDVSLEMIDAAKNKYATVNFFSDEKNIITYDYLLASGIFNVKPVKLSDTFWEQYVLEVLNTFNSVSSNGFAFNILTKYSDKDKMRPDLYYADPAFYFNYCKQHFCKNVALLHDYDLFEFTIIVRKE